MCRYIVLLLITGILWAQTDSEKEIYKQTYSNKLSERKFKYFLGCTIVTGVIVAVVLGGALKSFSMSGYDACFDDVPCK